MRQEPHWWTEAREMRARGLSLGRIGRRFGKDHTTVLYAVSEKLRARKAAGRISPIRKAPPDPEQQCRHRIVVAAREEAEERGEHVDTILIEWGSYPRWQQRRARVREGVAV